MKLDIKKLNRTPKDGFEAIDYMNEARGYLTDALHIMDSIITNNTEEFQEIHKRNLRDFINKFEVK